MTEQEMTNFDAWWADQDCNNLDTKDMCRGQWITFEQAGLSCSAVTRIMDDTWSAEFAKRRSALNDLTDMGQAADLAMGEG